MCTSHQVIFTVCTHGPLTYQPCPFVHGPGTMRSSLPSVPPAFSPCRPSIVVAFRPGFCPECVAAYGLSDLMSLKAIRNFWTARERLGPQAAGAIPTQLLLSEPEDLDRQLPASGAAAGMDEGEEDPAVLYAQTSLVDAVDTVLEREGMDGVVRYAPTNLAIRHRTGSPAKGYCLDECAAAAVVEHTIRLAAASELSPSHGSSSSSAACSSCSGEEDSVAAETTECAYSTISSRPAPCTARRRTNTVTRPVSLAASGGSTVSSGCGPSRRMSRCSRLPQMPGSTGEPVEDDGRSGPAPSYMANTYASCSRSVGRCRGSVAGTHHSRTN